MALSSSSTAAETKEPTTNLGVRAISAKICDSENGKTCHQCRHKTRSFAVACKNQGNGKPCILQFCHKCLLNRYGEKAEEVEVLEKWSCPRCRGICNCSCCRKKQGQLPTGILCHKAKATGFSSVSELLHANGPENFGHIKNVKDTGASPKKPSSSEKEIASPKKRGKENLFNGRVDMNLESLTPKLKELKKMQGETLKNDSLSKCSPCPDKKPERTSMTVYAVQKDAAALKGCSSGASHENSPNISRVSNISNNNDTKPNGKVDDLQVGDGCIMKVPTEVPADSFRNKRNADKDIIELDNEKAKKRVKHNTGVSSVKDNINGSRFQTRDVGVDIPLPHGTQLITICDVELPPEDVGNALQFLEFCAAFGKNLNMKKGQSSIILQKLMNGKTRTLRRPEQNSPVVHFHIQLLTLLQKESDSRPQKLSPSGGKNSWLLALKKCLSESPNAIDSLSIDCLDRETGGYYTLDSSTKLRILIFLCDEVLETARMRDWINDQELEFAKRAKQAKEKFLAAKDKEKSLKQKVTNELAKAIVAKDGASLSISEHDEIVRQIKCEADQARKEMLESMNMIPKAKERAKAVRTAPIFLDVDGRAFWRLNGYSEALNILVQDIGSGDDSVVYGEKWVMFDDEQEKVVEKHISFRERMVRAQPVAEMDPSQTSV